MVTYPCYEGSSTTLFDRMMEPGGHQTRGSRPLLHGCCHNPTGADLGLDQWRAVADMVAARGLVPFVDLAYQGFGTTEKGRRAPLVVAAAEQALVAQSCDKISAAIATSSAPCSSGARPKPPIASSNLLGLARTIWSMPPDHPAAVAHIILADRSSRL
jgi:aromatic-amino-acid transaminase